ncbi:MAG: hypothetical protein R3Y07_08055, partial [Eubacteriales bacterium]
MSTINSLSSMNSLYETATANTFMSTATSTDDESFSSLLEQALAAIDETDDTTTDDVTTDDTTTDTTTSTTTGTSTSYTDYRPEGYDPLAEDDMPSSTLDFTDMLALMIAQFQYQTIDNTASTTDMMNQLNQMTMTQAVTEMNTNMNELTQMNVQMYNAALVGQVVTVGTLDDDGNLVEIAGEVVGSGFYDGLPVIFLDGIDDPFYTSDIMAVGRLPEVSTDTEDEDTDDDTTVDPDDTTVDPDATTDPDDTTVDPDDT